jgi:glycosyltransferase involved in cell wall biosynthesis
VSSVGAGAEESDTPDVSSSRRPRSGVHLLRSAYLRLPFRWQERAAPLVRAARRVRAGRVSLAQLAFIGGISVLAVVLFVTALVLSLTGASGGITALTWVATLACALVAGHRWGWLTRPSSVETGPRVVRRAPTATEVKDQSQRFAEAARVIHAAAESVPEITPDRILPPPAGTPWVAIVVPAYNEKRFLADCLRSIQQQSFGDWECVIVDDASTDTTADIALRYVERDDRFSLVQHTFNQGLAAARNTGLAHVRAPLVTFLDGDDLMTSQSLADRVEAFQRHLTNDLAGVFCGVMNAPEEVTLEELEPSYEMRQRDQQMVDIATSEGVCPFAVHQPLIRTDLVRHLGAFDESFHHGAEDYDFWIRVLRAGYHFQPSETLSVIYRQRRGSMVREKITQHYEACRRILDKLDQPWDDAPPRTLHAPLPVTEPLGVFQRRLVLAERAIRWTGLAVATGNPDAALALLRQMDPHVPAFAMRHFDIESTIRKGVKRAWGAADDAFIAGYLPQIHSLGQDVRRYLSFRGQAQTAAAPPVVEAVGTGEGVLLCPASLPQALTMADLAASSPALKGAVFLTLDEIAGDQGAHSFLEERGLAPLRLRQAVNTELTAHTLVVADPCTVFTQTLAERAQAKGMRVLRLADTGPESLVEESASSVRALPSVPAAEVSSLTVSPDQPRIPLSSLAGLVRASLSQKQVAGLSKEERRELPFDADKMRAFKDAYKGERCVIIGNGPSLNKLDLSLMKDTPTFAVNGIFYAAESMGFDPTFYVVEDTAVMADNTEQIRAYRAHHKLFPAEYRTYIGESDEVTYFRMNRGFYSEASPHYSVPRFSTDAAKRVYCGQSVTIINLQLAYHFGFTEVALIGMDFSYNIPDSVIKEGMVFTSTEADENHFHPDYFGPGKKWKDPKLDRVLINYEQAKLFYEADGRRIVNATAGGNLHVFDRVDYDRWLA